MSFQKGIGMAAVGIELIDVGLRFDMRPRDTLKGMLLNRFGINGGTGVKPTQDFWAVRNVSFVLKPGDSLGIIGDNGAGKSTLLKLIVGIYPVTDGMIKVSGSVHPLLQTGLGFNPELTGEENVFLALSFFGLSKAEVVPLIDDIFRFCELGQFRYQSIKSYSGGMISRLAFGACTAIQGDILILDEVFSAGDIHWVEKGLERMKQLVASSKILVMVSHSMGNIRNYCNKVLWLKNGMVQRLGGLEVVDQYENMNHS